MKWYSVILGPSNSPWSGIAYRIVLNFSEDYPYKPPIVIFYDNNFFHPNIYPDGKTCIDILDKKWTPIYNVNTILSSLQLLIQNANPYSPANLKAARVFNRRLFDYYRVIKKVDFIRAN